MQRRAFVAIFACAATWPLTAGAQQKPAIIGFLGAGAAETSAPLVDALEQGLRENGLLAGTGYVLEARWAEGHYERFVPFVRELIGLGSRVIIVTTIEAARAAQRAAPSTPIVMATMNDPVGNGLVASLARPGGNTTGLASLNQDVTPKLMEFLSTFLPSATTLAVLFNPSNPSNQPYLDNVRTRAAKLGLSVRAYAVKTPDDLGAAFVTMAAQRPDALLIIPDAAIFDLGARIAALALQHRIAVISTDPDLTRAGGFVSFGFSRRENYRRSAYFVKRVLDGAKPADLPVEQPMRTLLSVNLRTANALGIAVPDRLLDTVDDVIE